MKILLQEWAEKNFRPAPCRATLRAWAKTGQIVPAPIKVGSRWMVDENAVYSRLEPIDNPELSPRVRAILNRC